jgi:hypothetical protein
MLGVRFWLTVIILNIVPMFCIAHVSTVLRMPKAYNSHTTTLITTTTLGIF